MDYLVAVVLVIAPAAAVVVVSLTGFSSFLATAVDRQPRVSPSILFCLALSPFSPFSVRFGLTMAAFSLFDRRLPLSRLPPARFLPVATMSFGDLTIIPNLISTWCTVKYSPCKGDPEVDFQYLSSSFVCARAASLYFACYQHGTNALLPSIKIEPEMEGDLEDFNAVPNLYHSLVLLLVAS